MTVRSGGEPVLDGVDVCVPGGAVVAVVGRSGAGKSVLAAVAGRLLDPDTGEVTLDGVPVASIARAALRRAVVYAFDRPALFGGTPREAIAFGVSRPSTAQVLAAARDAAASEFLRRLPAGLDTPSAEAPMSGGEIQRIGLARAFAHADQARLLILDDAMSSLDTVTEMHVSQALTGHLAWPHLPDHRPPRRHGRAGRPGRLAGRRPAACPPAASRAVARPPVPFRVHPRSGGTGRR